MNQYLKDQLPTFLVGALVVVLIFVIFRRVKDPSAVVNYQIEQLKAEMKQQLQREHDSIMKVLAVPIELPNIDSSQQVAIDLNNKILYELRKKRNASIDTISSAELRDIFAEYGRQHPVPTN